MKRKSIAKRRRKLVPLVPLEKRRCAYERCNRVFQPTWITHLYHRESCRIAAFNLKRARALHELATIKAQIRHMQAEKNAGAMPDPSTELGALYYKGR